MAGKQSYYVNVKLGGKKTLYVKGDYWDWNSVYRTYNSRKTNELLKWSDLNIRSTKTKR